MAYSKNKNPRYHHLRKRVRSSAVARHATSYHKKSTDFSTRFYYFAKNSVITIIITVAIAMVGFTIFNIIATPEHLVKKEIETITADYYENYFYQNILKNNSIYEKDVADPKAAERIMSNILEKYIERGFPRINLNQLLLYDNFKHYSSAELLGQYCNLENTFITIHPEPPFTSKDYRVDYDYSCNF